MTKENQGFENGATRVQSSQPAELRHTEGGFLIEQLLTVVAIAAGKSTKAIVSMLGFFIGVSV